MQDTLNALILPLVAIVGFSVSLCHRPELESGSSYENDWQQVPEDIQRTADKVELGLEVHPLEMQRFLAYLEEIEKKERN